MTTNITQPAPHHVEPDRTAPPIIRIRQLNKRYGKLHVLRDLDLDVAPAEKVSIIGPSGSGKSTVLRLLMTLERPNAGTIEIDGEKLWTMQSNGRETPASAAHVRQVRGKVGMVFQQFNLFPHMRVLKNVTLAPMQVLGLSKKDADERARDLLDKVGLADKVNAYPNQLSGGQKQRVAIARALAMQPKILLLDEVTSALDPELVGEVLNVLRHLATETDMTMLFVTHQMHFAREISDRVVFFDAGKILEARDPEGMFTDPKEERTRAFLKSVLEAS